MKQAPKKTDQKKILIETSPKPEAYVAKPSEQENGKTVRQEIILALIEHGSRPIAYVLIGLLMVGWLFSVREPLFNWLDNAQSVKIASFEIQLRTQAASADVVRELDALQGLNDDQLQLFLIIGKFRDPITYYGPELTSENLEKLRLSGLVSETHKESNGNLAWTLSEKGIKLHNILRNLIYSSIRKSGSP